MPAPIVSVIMATYNRAGFLDKSIDSILEQSFTDFELIIVNDGSSDNTAEALSYYEKRDGRIRVITQENQGLAAARNSGAKAARGEYLAFMDDDDASGVYRLEVQLDALRRRPDYDACGVYSGSMGGYEIEKGKKPVPGEMKETLNAGPTYETKLAGILGPNTFISRQSFLAVGGYRTQPTIIEDLDFTLRYSRKYKWLWLEGAPLYFYPYGYSQEQNSLSRRNVKKLIKRHIACYISEWCRHQGLADPVEGNKASDEVLSLTSSLPQEKKKMIYETMNHLCSWSLSLDIYALGILGYKCKFRERLYIKTLVYYPPQTSLRFKTGKNPAI